jgi:WD40 repeat protein
MAKSRINALTRAARLVSDVMPRDHGDKLRYDAFISYSRSQDEKLARALQHSLEQFAKRPFQRRALHVFRDDSSLSANPDLWASITDALRQSRHLVLLASPAAAESSWVADEIRYWLEHKSADTIITCVTAGDLTRDPATGGIDWDATTALPSVLKKAMKAEPRYVDLRVARDLDALPPQRLREVVADIAAPLHGMPKDEILGEAVRLHRRALRLAAAAVVALTVLSAVAVAFGVESRRQAAEAARQRDTAVRQTQITIAQSLTAQAEAIRSTQPRVAMRLGIAASHFDDDAYVRSSLYRTVAGSHMAETLNAEQEDVPAVDWSPAAPLMATGGEDSTVVLWDTSDPAHTVRIGQPLLGHSDSVWAVKFSPDGRLLAVTSFDNAVSVWNVADPANPRPVARLTGTGGRAGSLAWSPDGRMLATASAGGPIQIWDVSTPDQPQPLSTIKDFEDYDQGIYSLAWSPDGATLASGLGWNGVVFHDVRDPRAPIAGNQSPLFAPRPVTSLSWSRDGRAIAMASSDWNIRIWDVSSLSHPVSIAWRGDHTNAVSSVTWSPDGTRLASASYDGTVRVWDYDRVADELSEPTTFFGHTAEVYAVAWSPDGTRLVSGAHDETAIVWVLADRGLPRELPQGLPGVAGATFAPDGMTAVTAEDRVLRFWDLADPATPRPITQARPVAGTGALWSPDGRSLAVPGIDSAALWDVTDIRNPQPAASVDGELFAWAPGGAFLAAATGNYGLELWDVRDPYAPSLVASFPDKHDDRLMSLAWSPDGRWLVSASLSGMILVWDLRDKSVPKRAFGPLLDDTGLIWTAAWSPDGRLLATAGDDKIIQLWDMTDPTQPQLMGAPLEGYRLGINAVVWSPSGHYLAVTSGAGGNSEPGNASLWDVSDPTRPVLVGMLNPDHGSRGSVVAAWSGPTNLLLTNADDHILWDLSAQEDMRAHVVAYACSAAGGGLTESQWRVYLPTMPYVSTCETNR